MKKVLPFLVLCFCLFVSKKSVAQQQQPSCAVTDVAVQDVSFPDPNRPCFVEVDVTFVVGGSVNTNYIYLQTYIANAAAGDPNRYPNYFNCNGSGVGSVNRPPALANIGTPLLNVAINNTGATPALTTYLPDANVPIVGVVNGRTTVSTTSIGGGRTRYNISNLAITLPASICGNPFVLASDIFATPSPNGSVSCVSCNIQYFGAYFADIQGFAACGQYNIAYTRNSAAPNFTATYQVYADVDGSGTLGTNDALLTPTPLTFPQAVNGVHSIQGTVSPQYDRQDLLLQLTLNGGPATVDLISFDPDIECSVLPVTFKSFNAARKDQNVILTWETALEQNNKGFTLERNTSGEWEAVTNVKSKAPNGNSNAVLQYSFTDVNTTKGLTQYRLRQEDLDGKFEYSPVRSVNGYGQSQRIIIYPNPAKGGTVSVAFERSATREIVLSDAGGRVVRTWKNYRNANLNIDQLKTGFYTLRVIDAEAGTYVTEKIIVQ